MFAFAPSSFPVSFSLISTDVSPRWLSGLLLGGYTQPPSLLGFSSGRYLETLRRTIRFVKEEIWFWISVHRERNNEGREERMEME